MVPSIAASILHGAHYRGSGLFAANSSRFLDYFPVWRCIWPEAAGPIDKPISLKTESSFASEDLNG